MKTCRLCGKKISKQFDLCYACKRKQDDARAYHEYMAMSPQEREDQLEAYYGRTCSMCGKEGADYHGNDLFCGTCWTVWNG